MREALGRKRMSCKIAALDADLRVLRSRGCQCIGGAFFPLDCVDRGITGQSKREGPEPGEEIEDRVTRTDTGQNLPDEDFLGGRTHLQKPTWWIGDGDPRHDGANGAPLDHRCFIAWATPENPGKVALNSELGQRFE